MEIMKMNENIHRITLPYKDIFTTVYTVKTDKGVLLFDAASYDTDLEQYIQPMLDELKITAEDLKYIFISHNHTDHAFGIDRLMAEYPDKRVILCAHWFDMAQESEDFRRLLAEDERIVCLFCGHNHVSKISSTGDECGGKPILYTGNYSYSGEKNPVRCLCGYRELIITEEGVRSKYIVPAHTYQMEKVRFTTEYAEQDELCITF